MKRILTLMLTFALSHAVAANDVQHTLDTFNETPGVNEFFKNSVGYAVFPLVGKGGIGVGAAYGKGTVFKRGAVIGNAELVQLSIGFQLGGQAYSEMIFFKDERALNEFTSGNFEFGAEASAVALTAGASAKAGTTGSSTSAGLEQHSNQSIGEWYKGMAVFTIAKGGLMYQATIGGQKFSFTPKQ